jgi:DNA polymerase-3 subunit epsilon
MIRAPLVWAQTVYAHPDRWLILDTEATGSQTPEVIELAILDSTGQVVYESLFQPTTPINPFARRKHRISDAMLATAPRFVDALPAIQAIVGRRALLAYNAPFDRAMLDGTCGRYGCGALSNPWRCVMEHYQAWVGPNRPAGLSAVCAEWSLTAGQHGMRQRFVHFGLAGACEQKPTVLNRKP